MRYHTPYFTSNSNIILILFLFFISTSVVVADAGVAVTVGAPRFPTSLEGLYPTDKRPLAIEGGFIVDPTARETARLFYNTVYMSSVGVASGWNGNVNVPTCDAGTTSSDYQAATRRRVNWYRAMAGIPASIVFDSGFSAKAQQAALMMSANNALSHAPPDDWDCYTDDGKEAAGNSNLALGNAGSDAINAYIGDYGSNNQAVGHRRWILYPQTQTMGTGDVVPTNGSPYANALWAFDNNLWGPRPAVRDSFIAWPPKGYTPYQTVYPRWSISYPSADFSNAAVTMSRNGGPISVTQEPYSAGSGENTLVWIPSPYVDGQSWAKPTVDETYQITVSNIIINGQPQTFNYAVTVFDPATKGADYTPQQITGSGSITVDQPTTYTFSGISIANGYQWRQGSATDYTTINGAESGLGDFVATTSSSYSPISAGNPASGNAAYHLAHPEPPMDQTLTFNKSLFIGPTSYLQFSSYLGYATPNQYALVEASEDEGLSWIVLYQQAGSNTPESDYSSKNIPLTSFSSKTIQLRFRYQFSGGSYYYQTNDNVGWSFDNVQIIDGKAADFSTPIATNTSSNFVFTNSTPGHYLLQVRPLLFGDYPGEWSAAKVVDVTINNCGDGISLPTNQWQMLALPCVPDPATVSAVFGNSPTANLADSTYGSRWMIYQRNLTNTANTAMQSTSTLSSGAGYWIKSFDAPVNGKLVVEGAATPVQMGVVGCQSVQGCAIVSVPIGTVAGTRMLGNPFPYPVDWSKVRVRVGSTIYTPNEAFANNILDKQIWIWNGASYDTWDDSTDPGNLQYFKSFFIKVLATSGIGQTIDLLIPAESSTLSALSSGFGEKLVSTPVTHHSWPQSVLEWLIPSATAAEFKEPVATGWKRLVATGWKVRLRVENPKTGAKARALLGQRPDAEVGYDPADLSAMAPFAAPYLTLVFPQPTWDVHKGDYASDFRPVSGAPDRWNLELRTAPTGIPVVLHWEGDSTILARSRLIDPQTGAVIHPRGAAYAKGYSLTLTTPVRRLIWEYLGE